jgi:hypothetical protein
MTHTYTIGNLTNNNSVQVSSSGTGASGSSYTVTSNIVGSPGTSTVGQIYTTGISTGYTLNNPNDSVMIVKQDPAMLEVKGNLVINGIDLEERLKKIEQVLTIPERDVKLERKHPKLKKMYDDYIKALAKYRTWDAIKGEE